METNVKKRHWEIANKRLLAKMIAEFLYEDMISAEKTDGLYHLSLDGGTMYRFQAEERLMDSYWIDPDSIQIKTGGEWTNAKSAVVFLLELQKEIGIKPFTAAYLIEEYKRTLLADAHIMASQENQRTESLLEIDYAELEGEMTGHPWITYNKGRIGFSYTDYLQYAPEQKKEVKLDWIAVSREKGSFHSIEEVNYEDLLKSELGDSLWVTFQKVLHKKGIQPEDYFFMPVHEWQWNHVLVPLFSEELFEKRIVYLGKGEDEYLPQQSIRTFVNMKDKMKYHVKLPMSILNTLVYRGLPSERVVLAPEITQHIQGIRDRDSFLRDTCRVVLPGEIASMNYAHPDYTKLQGAPYQFLEMLGVIWRESIYSFLDEGEQAITLAALLYVGEDGESYALKLAKKAGLNAEEWTKQLFDVLLPPLLHYLYQYGTVFSPHGQNTVVILKDSKPHRLAVKDFVDDVNISDQPLSELENISAELKNVLRSEAPEGLCQFIFTGLFVCHFRYLADILHRSRELDEAVFWNMLRETILSYQAQFPELKERFELFDLLRPSFKKLCLNRNRMIEYGYGDGDDRPHASEFGRVKNPLATGKPAVV
ncbi:IucA/IucC family siderophore biosynthesis protein [Neobacillus sp. 179-C4.2 HS]|uniref:IucA/IucC family siderophore biosynthesis protein n=1 Tax=Neobacillus driksii TaxID=3035913 RepID=A0ABV4YLH8_9BACI|nr:IucA/IucC family siderophore biosynthesis protein [Neobacillus sp. 179.-C4.2 HS]MDP5196269.1 IucA/IucC family siderophore biosynthesis protein [Neobacillus sp. 179.-C4.2 HS]